MIIFAIALFVLMGVLTAAGALAPLTDMLINVIGNEVTLSGYILVAIIIGVVGLPIAGFLNSFSAALIFSYIFKALPAGLLSGLWFGFVLSGNVGGALTPLGSITILMSLEILNREGYPMSFLKYVKKMLPLTLTLGVLSITYSIILIALQSL